MARFLSASASEAGASEETDLLLRQSAAVSVALAHPRMGRDHVAALLRRLAEAVPVHSLFMKTCMQAVQRFPDLVAWLLDNLLPKLIQGLVWKHPVLWKVQFSLVVSRPLVKNRSLFLRGLFVFVALRWIKGAADCWFGFLLTRSKVHLPRTIVWLRPCGAMQRSTPTRCRICCVAF